MVLPLSTVKLLLLRMAAPRGHDVTAPETITLTLPGKPCAKARPRFTRTGHTYTDAKTAAAEQSILAAWLVTAGSRAPHTGPVTVHVLATFAPAQSWPKWRKQKAGAGLWPHTTKPDLDNLVKILDGLNGRAWVDDAQITGITAEKRFGEDARTVVRVTLWPASEGRGK